MAPATKCKTLQGAKQQSMNISMQHKRAGCKAKAIISEAMIYSHPEMPCLSYPPTSTHLLCLYPRSSPLSLQFRKYLVVLLLLFSPVSILLFPPVFSCCLSVFPSFSFLKDLLQSSYLAITQDRCYGPK